MAFSPLSLFFRPFSWLRRQPPTDYEQVLSTLQADIEHVQSNLVQIQSRKRRATIILPLWASLLWLLWTTASWYAGYLSQAGLRSGGWWIWGPILLAPLFIFFTRRIVRWWYKRVGAAEQDHLKELQRQRKAKIEEIKRATRYDHLRLLLEKYDDEGKGTAGRLPQTPVKQGQRGPTQQQGAGAINGGAPGGPANNATQPGRTGPGNIQQVQQLPSAMRGQASQQQQQAFGRTSTVPSRMPPAGPIHRTWVDRMADAVLGADPSAAALGPEQKYALICSNCKRHNGLAAKEEFDEIQYICPHCGTYNTRRPSSVPVSSPWRTTQSPASAQPAAAAAASPPAGPKSSSLSKAALRRDLEDSDSAPPSSPLARSDTDDEGEQEEQLIKDKKKEGESKSGLSQRRSGRIASQTMELD